MSLLDDAVSETAAHKAWTCKLGIGVTEHLAGRENEVVELLQADNVTTLVKAQILNAAGVDITHKLLGHKLFSVCECSWCSAWMNS